MGDYQSPGHQQTLGTRPPDAVGVESGHQCHLVRLADRLPMALFAERVSESQQRVLSLSQMVLGWDVGKAEYGATGAPSASSRPQGATQFGDYRQPKRANDGGRWRTWL